MDLIQPYSIFPPQLLLPILGNTFLVFLTFSDVLWVTQEARAAGSHRIRVQGTQETDAFSFDWCRHRATFAPWGFVDRGALLSLLISSFEYCTKIFELGGKKKKKNTQRRAAEECRV